MPKQNNARDYRPVITFLTFIFLFAGITSALLAFFYPLEIETRESSVWLDVLAMKAGVNIYDHSQVAFANMTHGPLDTILKFFITSAFPFLESWQVIRLPIFLSPYLFLLAAWVLLRKKTRSFLDVLYLGSLGFVLLTTLSDQNMLLVGRTDGTAILLLIIWLLAAIACPMGRKRYLYGFISGMLAGCVFMTNWRFMPMAVLVLLFTLSRYKHKYAHDIKKLLTYAACYGTGFIAIYTVFFGFVYSFNFDLYYKHLFTFVFEPDKWDITFWNNRDFLGRTFWPLLTSAAVYLAVPGKKKPENIIWAVFAFCVFIIYGISLYINQDGGGAWYYMPFLITLWFYLGTNYENVPRKNLSRLGILILCAYSAITFTDQGGFPVRLASTIRKAGAFMDKVRLAEKIGTITSEDVFLYKRSYEGELVDLGDHSWSLATAGYLDADFAATAKKHFERLFNDPPDFIVTGFTESPFLAGLLANKYDLIENGPDNLIADRMIKKKFRSQLYARKDIKLPTH